jgi:hypothetical protein
MAGLTDIRDTLPSELQLLLLDEEKVYFYGSGKGCLGGKKSFIMVTDNRVHGSSVEKGSRETLDIPIEHISSVRVTAGGCLFSKTGSVAVSSGTATNSFAAGKPDDAQRAATIIQAAMREAKKKSQG